MTEEPVQRGPTGQSWNNLSIKRKIVTSIDCNTKYIKIMICKENNTFLSMEFYRKSTNYYKH